MSKTERDKAREYLAEDIATAPRDRDGRPVLIFDVTTVARSGMSRRIRVFYVTEHRTVRNVSYLVGAACGMPWNDNGVRVDGAGMDMRFHLADCIAHVLGIGNGNDISRDHL